MALYHTYFPVAECNKAPEIGVPISIDALTRENATPIRVLRTNNQKNNLQRTQNTLTHVLRND